MDKYPLRMCETCIHSTVCKWIAVFENMKNASVPLDLSIASCKLYLPTSDDMDLYDSEEIDDIEGILEAIDEQIDQYYSEGIVPESVQMCQETYDTCEEDLPVESKEGNLFLKTCKGLIPLIINDMIPVYEFIILTTK